MIKGLIALVALLAVPEAALAQGKTTGRLVGQVTVDYDWGHAAPDRSLIREVEGATPPYEWLSASDYPAAARRAGSTGSVKIDVRVGADDRMLGCTVRVPAKDPRLTAVVCPLIARRAKFRHALAADGSPREAVMSFEVMFELVPEAADDAPAIVYVPPTLVPTPGARQVRLPEPVDADAQVIRGASPTVFPQSDLWAIVDIDAHGTVTRCRISDSSGTDEGDFRICRQMTAARFRPKLDEDGAPVAMDGFYVGIVLQP